MQALMPSNSLPALTFATVVLLFTTIVVGGYVSQTGAGLACPDWPLCPLSLDAFVVVEFVHRILAITAFLVALATFIAARRTHSSVAPKKLITAGFILLIVQVFLIGSSVIYSSLEPILVTAHLGVAVTVLSLYVASYIQMRGNPKGKN